MSEQARVQAGIQTGVFIGELKSKRVLPGLSGDMHVVVDSENFYWRLGLPRNKRCDADVGNMVRVEFADTETRLSDWLLDRLGFGYGTPREYKEIISISRAS